MRRSTRRRQIAGDIGVTRVTPQFPRSLRSLRWRRAARATGAAGLGLLGIAAAAQGQPASGASRGLASEPRGGARFTSPGDSVEWERARALAAGARGFRLVISLRDRRLWVIVDPDTLLAADVAVGSGASLEYQGRQWSFATPRGRRTVAGKDSLPVWVPPEWHYYEVARERGLVVRHLVAGQPVLLDDGTRLEVRSETVGLAGADSAFVPLPAGDEIIFDGFLFVPPVGTTNRRIDGELGRYKLDLTGGYLLHGTPYRESIGQAVTHGCIRLRDDDIAWLYEFVPVGTPVYIY